MAKARPIPGLAPEDSFRVAAAAVVETRAREVFEHAEGVLDTSEIEHVHAMRVASRRLRAALEVFAVCFPQKRQRRVLREVEQLADALGRRRDPDVAIERLRALADAFHVADRPGIEGLVAELRTAQRTANDALAATLEQTRASELERRLLELAEAARP